jgi:hypothetical protein
MITARISQKGYEDLKMIKKDEKVNRAEITRRLLSRGISDWKKEKTPDLLKDHTITIQNPVVLAGISYLDMLDLTKDDYVGYDSHELVHDGGRL